MGRSSRRERGSSGRRSRTRESFLFTLTFDVRPSADSARLCYSRSLAKDFLTQLKVPLPVSCFCFFRFLLLRI